MNEIYEFLFVKGGPVMYPIVLGSVVALSLFLERIWALRRERVTPPVFQRRLRVLLREGKLSEAEVLCQENASALANIVGVGIKHAGEPKDEIKEAINDVGRRETAMLERYVEFMGTIAAVEPLMGLLGTVTGLIRAFQRVEALARANSGGVNPEVLAGGIWEALITTAAGLVVAIPAYVGYRYLQGRAENLSVDLEEYSLQIGELIAKVEPRRRRRSSSSGAGKPPRDRAPAGAERDEERSGDEGDGQRRGGDDDRRGGGSTDPREPSGGGEQDA